MITRIIQFHYISEERRVSSETQDDDDHKHKMRNNSTNSSAPSIYSFRPVSLLDTNSTACLTEGLAFSLVRTALTIPLSIFILYLGHQRWRQQPSFTMMSHTDVFTFHFAAMELLWPLGVAIFISGVYTNNFNMSVVGSVVIFGIFYGGGFFHLVTCVDRYLAAVHPITYLGLRSARGVRIRNISIGCVWLLAILWGSAINPDLTLVRIPLYVYLVFLLTVISLCSLSILWVLVQPGPGDRGGDTARVDQSKQRALCTLRAILTVQWLWFLGFLVCSVLSDLHPQSEEVGCLLRLFGLWFNLPSTLILPVLYLHRSGKLGWCRRNIHCPTV